MKKPLLFRPREKFLVLEIASSGTNGVFLSVDNDRNLILEKVVRHIDLKKFLKSPVRRATQQSWEGEYFFKGHRRVIAVADSSIATTIPVPVELSRDAADAKHEITISELENLISQEMAKIFNTCRSEAAARLGIHELDAMLVGEKAKYFRVDGNLVMNPAGFAGKKVSLLLELTFTGRELFESLKDFFNAPDEFFFAESSQVRLTSLGRVRKLPLNLISAPGNDERGAMSLYVLQSPKNSYPVLYRESFAWNFSRIFDRIQAELGVSLAAARELYAQYLDHDFSESAARAFRKVLDPAIEELLREVAKKKLKGFVYMDAPYALPFEMPHHEGAVIFDALPLAEIMNSLGFSGAQDAALGTQEMSRHLMPFLEAYFDKSNMEINQKLRRRLHWLAG